MDSIDLVFTIFLTLVGIIFGAIITYIYGVKGNEKKIEYEITSYKLISETLSEKLSQTPTFKILSGEEPISSLSSSLIRIENTGFKALKSEDFTPEHPIRITVNRDKNNNNTRIYFSQIIERHGVDNNFDLISDSSTDNETQKTEINYYQLSFHHINRGEGVKIRVFHSGKEDDDLKIYGVVIDGPPISKKPEWKKDTSKNSPISMMSAIITYAAFFILALFFIPTSIVASLGVGVLFFIITLFAMFACMMITQWILYKVQEKLRKYVYKLENW
jgi:hypothetical protein